MRKPTNFGARPASGFTLIELMVVVTVITILTVIAVPSYTSQVRKSRRTEAKSMLLDLAAREERYMATAGVYSSTATDLGLASYPQLTSTGYYSIAAPTVTLAATSSATTAATAATYSFTATASGSQVKDTECNTFTITNTGLQTSTNLAAGPTTDCW